jgi:hypothetical protein
VTLFSASSRSQSPASSPPRKAKRVPAPLVLAKEIQIEAALKSARELKPPASPHANLLRGMEMAAKDIGVNGMGMSMTMHSPGAVGVAF